VSGPIVIDESGTVQQWTAVYWRCYSRYEEPCDTFADAFRFLEYGSDAGSLAARAILGPDGNVLLDADALRDAWAAGVDPDDLFVRLSGTAALTGEGSA
jgi:hypothetical protein